MCTDKDEFTIISVYTREQAIADGVLMDVSDMAKEAGFKWPVAVTLAVWNKVVIPTPHDERDGQSKEGRLDQREHLRSYGTGSITVGIRPLVRLVLCHT
jgi:uncharacterized protein DUF6573